MNWTVAFLDYSLPQGTPSTTAGRTMSCAICKFVAPPISSAFRDQFFFFQAEDGIRDSSVTGVQTCALPIYLLKQHRDVGSEIGNRFHFIAQNGGERGNSGSAVEGSPARHHFVQNRAERKNIDRKSVV